MSKLKAMICPKCGLEFQNWVKVCTDCEIPLVEGYRHYCPNCGAAIVPHTIRCVRCKALLTSNGELVEAVENVSILDKDNNKLCSIHYPQKWILLVPLFVKKWDDPQSVVRWAWHQTFETHAFYLEHNITTFGADSPATPCVMCKTQSVRPVWVNVLFRSGVTGIQCENTKCTMYSVTIPWRMLKNIKEVPEEYIPAGFYVKRPYQKREEPK